MKSPACLLAACLFALPASAITVTEPPDQANSGPGTIYVLENGTNTISGTVSTSSDGQDRFQVSVPEGMTLTAVSKTTSGGDFSGGFVSFNNVSIEGLGTSTYSGLPLGSGTYSVLISTNFTVSTSWSLTFTVLNPGTIIGVEQFDYPDGSIGGSNGGTFWDYKNFTPAGHTGTFSDWDNVTNAPTVSAGRLVTNNSSAKREYNGASEYDGAVNDPASSPSSVQKVVYHRVSVTTGATLPTFFGLSSYDFGAERLFFGKPAGSGNFGIDEAGAVSPSTTAILPNTTYTLVTKIDYTANKIALYVNPDLNAEEITQTPAITRDYLASHWSTAVRLASGSGGNPVTWDDLVIATTWDKLGTVVTTLDDEDDGPNSLNSPADISLREAVRYSPTGSFITFAPGLSGKTITLTHVDGDMQIPGALTIDASALPGGITVSGNYTSRHFNVENGKTLDLRGLTLTGGNDLGQNGGSIFNNGTLKLTQCTLSGNFASTPGGAIMNLGGLLTLTHCTLSGNSSSADGGAIYNSSTLALTQCTLSGNSAANGGAIYNYNAVTLNNSIVAGNRLTGAGSGADIYNQVSVTRTGTNLVQSLVNNTFATATGPVAINADPKLTPLGHFGGPVQTMHPLTGSPAIDAAGPINPGGTDARGFPRFVDGDNSTVPQLDIGAVEAGPTLRVTQISDFTGIPSLRQQLANAAMLNEPGVRIVFDPTVFPNFTIILGGTELTPPAGKAIFIDASNLSAPVTLSGNNASRVFNIPATATVAMHSVKIVGGKTPDGTAGQDFTNGGNGAPGGGVFNAGCLSLFSCTLSGNATGDGGGGGIGNGDGGIGGMSGSGGGIFSTGTLCLDACTLSNNATGNGGGGGEGGVNFGDGNGGDGGNAGNGGGIFSSGPLTLTTCTLSGNTTGRGGNGASGGRSAGGRGGNGGNGGNGGGIYNSGPCDITACSFSQNLANSGGDGGPGGEGYESGVGGQHGSGGGIYSTQAYSLSNTIVAGNTASSAPDVSGTATGTNNLTSGDPKLAPLGDYGGPTQTMALRPGSPARNAGSSTGRATDQRGFPLVGLPDIGAYEACNALLTNYNAFIWETLPATATAPQTATTFDFDGDGQSNELEWLAGTGVIDPASAFRPVTTRNAGGDLVITFPTLVGRTYRYQRSDDLTPASWITVEASARAGTGSPESFVLPTTTPLRRFFRLHITQP